MLILLCLILVALIVFSFLTEDITFIVWSFVVSILLTIALLVHVYEEDKQTINQDIQTPAIISELELDMINNQPFNNRNFDTMLLNIKALRTNSQTTAPVMPYCDVLDYVTAYSLTIKSNNTRPDNKKILHNVLNLLYTTHPEVLESCSQTQGAVVKPKATKSLTKLPTEIIEKLTEVAGECNIAKTQLIINELTTVEEVNKVIKQCKADKLREVLNK